MTDTFLLILTICATGLSLGAGILLIVLLLRTKKKDNSEDFRRQRDELHRDLTDLRTELNGRMDSVQTKLSGAVTEGIKSGNDIQMTALKNMTDRIDKMNETTEKRLLAIQESNQKKLDEMQGAVNEKLESALEKRVTESFKLVNDRLEQVYKGLGEMQTLAGGVGDLKKLLSNVKTRGIFGEIQLSRILEQILTKEQYKENVATIPGSTERVEFAVCLPGKDDGPVYLPIDSKFPMDLYEQLLEAAETGDAVLTETRRKALNAFLKKNAKDIREKYVKPPFTTDFAILFLPVEGLYAEVVRDTELTETLMRNYNVNVAGPSTVSAFLNSLQMGFRTVAIEQQTHKIWEVLGAVKSEFETFENVLNSVKKRLDNAGDDLEKLVGTRTRAIRRKLRDVESLPAEEAKNYFDELLPGAEDTEE